MFITQESALITFIVISVTVLEYGKDRDVKNIRMLVN